MHAHSHWTDNEERIAWNSISRALMAAHLPNSLQCNKVEVLACERGKEDAKFGDRGDYEDGLTDSRQCLLSLLDNHPGDDRAALATGIESTIDACRAAYSAAWSSPSPRA